ncbi:MAG: hypothetical protein UX79_C0025G0001, partial [candidate division WWE3 bacterium GW2011_GWB1_47_11]
ILFFPYIFLFIIATNPFMPGIDFSNPKRVVELGFTLLTLLAWYLLTGLVKFLAVKISVGREQPVFLGKMLALNMLQFIFPFVHIPLMGYLDPTGTYLGESAFSAVVWILSFLVLATAQIALEAIILKKLVSPESSRKLVPALIIAFAMNYSLVTTFVVGAYWMLGIMIFGLTIL